MHFSRAHIVGRALALAALSALLSACGGGGAGPAAAAAAASAPLLVAPEDLRTLGTGTQASGPLITGAIAPERRADLRAEVAAVVLQVAKENGEAVKSGDLLVRLDDTAIRDSLTSAQAAERAATLALDQAERAMQRLKTLQTQGMTSAQALDDAEMRRNAAQSDLVGARARVVSARQQLERTQVRAPFAGVVAARKVSVGDTAQIGKELVQVIDPKSMRFEGLVSADQMHALALGQPVVFRVNGYPGTEFTGKVQRIAAAANANTRQVEVLVAFDDRANAPVVSGLFAEGRVQAGSARVLTVPEASVVISGSDAYVWRVAGGKLAKVSVQLGERDARSGDYPVQSGLAVGDVVLRSPSGALADGQAVQTASAKAAPAASAPVVGKT